LWTMQTSIQMTYFIFGASIGSFHFNPFFNLPLQTIFLPKFSGSVWKEDRLIKLCKKNSRGKSTLIKDIRPNQVNKESEEKEGMYPSTPANNIADRQKADICLPTRPPKCRQGPQDADIADKMPTRPK
jgi:hypothetical protein